MDRMELDGLVSLQGSTVRTMRRKRIRETLRREGCPVGRQADGIGKGRLLLANLITKTVEETRVAWCFRRSEAYWNQRFGN